MVKSAGNKKSSSFSTTEVIEFYNPTMVQTTSAVAKSAVYGFHSLLSSKLANLTIANNNNDNDLNDDEDDYNNNAAALQAENDKLVSTLSLNENYQNNSESDFSNLKCLNVGKNSTDSCIIPRKIINHESSEVFEVNPSLSFDLGCLDGAISDKVNVQESNSSILPVTTLATTLGPDHHVVTATNLDHDPTTSESTIPKNISSSTLSENTVLAMNPSPNQDSVSRTITGISFATEITQNGTGPKNSSTKSQKTSSQAQSQSVVTFNEDLNLQVKNYSNDIMNQNQTNRAPFTVDLTNAEKTRNLLLDLGLQNNTIVQQQQVQLTVKQLQQLVQVNNSNCNSGSSADSTNTVTTATNNGLAASGNQTVGHNSNNNNLQPISDSEIVIFNLPPNLIRSNSGNSSSVKKGTTVPIINTNHNGGYNSVGASAFATPAASPRTQMKRDLEVQRAAMQDLVSMSNLNSNIASPSRNDYGPHTGIHTPTCVNTALQTGYHTSGAMSPIYPPMNLNNSNNNMNQMTGAIQNQGAVNTSQNQIQSQGFTQGLAVANVTQFNNTQELTKLLHQNQDILNAIGSNINSNRSSLNNNHNINGPNQIHNGPNGSGSCYTMVGNAQQQNQMPVVTLNISPSLAQQTGLMGANNNSTITNTQELNTLLMNLLASNSNLNTVTQGQSNTTGNIATAASGRSLAVSNTTTAFHTRANSESNNFGTNKSSLNSCNSNNLVTQSVLNSSISPASRRASATNNNDITAKSSTTTGTAVPVDTQSESTTTTKGSHSDGNTNSNPSTRLSSASNSQTSVLNTIARASSDENMNIVQVGSNGGTSQGTGPGPVLDGTNIINTSNINPYNNLNSESLNLNQKLSQSVNAGQGPTAGAVNTVGNSSPYNQYNHWDQIQIQNQNQINSQSQYQHPYSGSNNPYGINYTNQNNLYQPPQSQAPQSYQNQVPPNFYDPTSFNNLYGPGPGPTQYTNTTSTGSTSMFNQNQFNQNHNQNQNLPNQQIPGPQQHGNKSIIISPNGKDGQGPIKFPVNDKMAVASHYRDTGNRKQDHTKAMARAFYLRRKAKQMGMVIDGNGNMVPKS